MRKRVDFLFGMVEVYDMPHGRYKAFGFLNGWDSESTPDCSSCKDTWEQAVSSCAQTLMEESERLESLIMEDFQNGNT
jgi:hypothetical protein